MICVFEIPLLFLEQWKNQFKKHRNRRKLIVLQAAFRKILDDIALHNMLRASMWNTQGNFSLFGENHILDHGGIVPGMLRHIKMLTGEEMPISGSGMLRQKGIQHEWTSSGSYCSVWGKRIQSLLWSCSDCDRYYAESYYCIWYELSSSQWGNYSKSPTKR